jgi:hypothetical protein
MRLEDFDLNPRAVTMAPYVRNEPEPDWVAAKDSGILPESMFTLYTRSSYLSFGSAPSFLSDKDHFLFSYFGFVLRSIKDCLLEADSELQIFAEAQGKGYDPEKSHKGEKWDTDADAVARRNFQLLLMSLLASLDGAADLVALFLTDSIKGLVVGRALFSKIEAWLRIPLPKSPLVITPQQQKLEDLYKRIEPLVCTQGEEQDWLKFARILRNKSAHIKNSLRSFTFKHSDQNLYTFLPARWPFFWEQHMHATGTAPPAGFKPIPQLFLDTLIHQDIVSYGHDLRDRITTLLGETLAEVDAMCIEFQNFPQNQAALSQLVDNFEATGFRAFRESGQSPPPLCT